MNLSELLDKRLKTTKIFSDSLVKWGYTGANVEGLNICVTKSGERRLRDSVEILFWKGSYGYQLSVRDKSDAYDLDGFVLACEKVLLFARDSKILQSNYESSFFQHLEKQGFINLKASCTNRFDSYFSRANFWNDQYSIYLYRLNIDEALQPSETEDSDEEIEFDYSILTNEINKILDKCEIAGTYKSETTFLPDRLGVIIFNQTFRYNLFIQSHLEMIEFETELVSLVVDCFARAIKSETNDILHRLDFCGIHIHKQDPNTFSAIICNKLDVFTIAAWSERLPQNGAEESSLLIPTQRTPSFDNMNGNEFEVFCAKVLRCNGFNNVTITQGSGDQGIDIIAYKDSIKYGVQCKCYSSDVGNKAVQEVLAGVTYYNCDIGVVLTNRHFTKSAMDLANKSRIRLWDRDKLLQMVSRLK